VDHVTLNHFGQCLCANFRGFDERSVVVPRAMQDF
jgi:hypothetical protein